LTAPSPHFCRTLYFPPPLACPIPRSSNFCRETHSSKLFERQPSSDRPSFPTGFTGLLSSSSPHIDHPIFQATLCLSASFANSLSYPSLLPSSSFATVNPRTATLPQATCRVSTLFFPPWHGPRSAQRHRQRIFQGTLERFSISPLFFFPLLWLGGTSSIESHARPLSKPASASSLWPNPIVFFPFSWGHPKICGGTFMGAPFYLSRVLGRPCRFFSSRVTPPPPIAFLSFSHLQNCFLGGLRNRDVCLLRRSCVRFGEGPCFVRSLIGPSTPLCFRWPGP